MINIEMGGNPRKGFVEVALAKWRKHVEEVVDREIARNTFIMTVRALTGWSEAAAKRLDARLGKLAEASEGASHDDYRREWRRRYSEGWKHAKWPHAMRRFVK